MAKVFITLTGTKHYFGNEFLKKGTKIRLEKEPDNEYDQEAIKVTYEGSGNKVLTQSIETSTNVKKGQTLTVKMGN